MAIEKTEGILNKHHMKTPYKFQFLDNKHALIMLYTEKNF